MLRDVFIEECPVVQILNEPLPLITLHCGTEKQVKIWNKFDWIVDRNMYFDLCWTDKIIQSIWINRKTIYDFSCLKYKKASKFVTNVIKMNELRTFCWKSRGTFTHCANSSCISSYRIVFSVWEIKCETQPIEIFISSLSDAYVMCII